jgi:hypothetical protein
LFCLLVAFGAIFEDVIAKNNEKRGENIQKQRRQEMKNSKLFAVSIRLDTTVVAYMYMI